MWTHTRVCKFGNITEKNKCSDRFDYNADAYFTLFIIKIISRVNRLRVVLKLLHVSVFVPKIQYVYTIRCHGQTKPIVKFLNVGRCALMFREDDANKYMQCFNASALAMDDPE